ncbi:MAG: 2-C-methyl-D-erythritol 4-phosphate cytidylyltransferase [Lachnospiraceae bacterium]|nr:2-C-methyl-D-erythritol 4-phosphate cytidylyltransferase [Lachnospiraceae bacterium]
MVKALIFAGGTGQRMNSRSKPKQFLEMHGKPIIIYTIEHFEYHSEVDEIVVVCIKEWIDELNGFLKRYGITKVSLVIEGGDTGHDSISLGLKAMEKNTKSDDIILIHDGVRPLITEELISKNIAMAKEYGNAITSEPVRESVVRSVDAKIIDDVPPRSEMYVAKAPQTFKYKDIVELYELAHSNGHRSIDSAHLCAMYNVQTYLVQSTRNNIKITEPADYYIFRALYEAIEGQQIFGL